MLRGYKSQSSMIWQIFRYEIRCGQSLKQKLIVKIIRRMKKSYFQVIDDWFLCNFALFLFYLQRLMVSAVLGKKYKRANIHIHIQELMEFCRIAPFIGSHTLQPLKKDLCSGKGDDQCWNSNLCQSFVCKYAERFVHIYIYIYINEKNQLKNNLYRVSQKKLYMFLKVYFWRHVIEILQNFERVLWNHISVNILNGVMIKEEAMIIKEQLHNSEFDDFSASDGWLDCWKTYSVKERCIVGEAGDVSTEPVTSWMEGINELIEAYSLENIWNMDEFGCFFKARESKTSKG